MSIQVDQLPITSPCPINLDRSGVSAKDRQMFCEHCTKDVHLLSQMTESEARALMNREAGKDICVSYVPRSDGSIRFRPEPAFVPATALTRAQPRTRTVRANHRLSLALGGMLLAACTPHGDAEPKQDPLRVEVPADEVIPCDDDGSNEPEPDYAIAGGLRAEPIELEPVEGGLVPPELEPEDEPKPEPEDEPGADGEPEQAKRPKDPLKHREMHRRGGIRAPADLDPLGDL